MWTALLIVRWLGPEWEHPGREHKESESSATPIELRGLLRGDLGNHKMSLLLSLAKAVTGLPIFKGR